MEKILQELIYELEIRKNNEEPENEGYNLGLNVGIIEIKKMLIILKLRKKLGKLLTKR